MHCLLPRPRRLITDRVWDRRSRARRRVARGNAAQAGRDGRCCWQAPRLRRVAAFRR